MNKKTALFICLLITMVVTCGILTFSILNRAASAPELPIELKRFTSEEGSFSILMPGEPKKNTIKLNTKSGTVDTVQFFFKQKWNPLVGATFAIEYVDVPANVVKEQSPEKRLSDAKGLLFNSRKGRRVSEKAIYKAFLVDDQPGWEVRFSANLSSIATSQNIFRFFEINHRFYRVMYSEYRRFHFSNKINEDLAYKFLDSFASLITQNQT